MENFLVNNAFHIISLIVILIFNAGVNFTMLGRKVDEVEFERYKASFKDELDIAKGVVMNGHNKDMKSTREDFVQKTEDLKSSIKTVVDEHIRSCPFYHIDDKYYTRNEGVRLETIVEEINNKMTGIVASQRSDTETLKVAINQMTEAILKEKL